jgi:hypothetical protein
MRARHSQQRDLFAEDCKTPPKIPSAQRSVLLRLIENLLAEAIAARPDDAAPPDQRNDGGRT